MKTICPSCKQAYEVEDKYLGEIIECQKCRKQFVIEAFQEPPLKKIQDTVSAPVKEAIFKIPILSRIFNVFGILSLIGTALFIVLAFLATYNGASALPLFLPLTFGSLLNALIMFGIAEVIKAISETAFNTRELLKLQKDRK